MAAKVAVRMIQKYLKMDQKIMDKEPVQLKYLENPVEVIFPFEWDGKKINICLFAWLCKSKRY